LAERRPAPGLVHHSDRGVQYASREYVQRLEAHGIAISMSRPGTPYDNAWAESFIKTLKAEEVNAARYRDLQDAKMSIGAFIEDVYNQRKMDRIFALIDRYCFQGHTHVPGVFTESLQDDSYQFQSPEELTDSTHKLDDRKTMINVGSVGQPRDGNWKACYVLLDDTNVTFRRVEYDIDTTIKKIHDIPDLDNFLGDRLRDGR